MQGDETELSGLQPNNRQYLQVLIVIPHGTGGRRPPTPKPTPARLLRSTIYCARQPWRWISSLFACETGVFDAPIYLETDPQGRSIGHWWGWAFVFNDWFPSTFVIRWLSIVPFRFWWLWRTCLWILSVFAIPLSWVLLIINRNFDFDCFLDSIYRI